MLRRLRSVVLLEVRGAAPLRCLNRWTAADLSFWKLEYLSVFSFRCLAYEKELPLLEREAGRAQCETRVLRRTGLPVLLRRLRARPVISAGTVLALGAVFLLQNFVWFLRVEGNERLSAQTILQALAEEGVRFGAWGPGLDSEDLKNRMLNRVPELRWLAVNREGGLVTVLTAERQPEEPALEKEGVTNLIAARPGLVRELRVLNGFAQVAPGDAVAEGDLLISGVMEWTNRVQVTRAMGEVYADTLHAMAIICPDTAWEKRYTGRVERCLTIIFQRKRRKLSGNSSIFGTMCDRMIETRTWTLPGGYTLPVSLELETLREYSPEPTPISEAEAASLLKAEAERLTRTRLVSGQIQRESAVIQKKQNSFCCRTVLNCLELISRTVPAELFGEEENHGKADQRRADRTNHQRVRQLRRKHQAH